VLKRRSGFTRQSLIAASKRREQSMTPTPAARIFALLLILVPLAAFINPARAADLVALTPENWHRYIPQGKEVDGIYGDFALVNDQIMSVIAHPGKGRHANMTVRDVGGCLIDLTRRDRQSDLLAAYYPGARFRELNFAGIDVESPVIHETGDLARLVVRARSVTLRLVAPHQDDAPDIEVSYTLADGWHDVQVATRFSNPGQKPVDADLLDSLRLDGSFETSAEDPAELFWAYDRHFGQAYGLVAEDGHRITGASARQMLLQYRDPRGKVTVRLGTGQTYRLSRRIFPGAHLFDIRRVAGRLTSKQERLLQVTVKDPAGVAVADADVVLARQGKHEVWGRTDGKGQLVLDVDEKPASLVVSSIGYGSKEIALTPPVPPSLTVLMPEPTTVVGRITDERGGTIPCKVQFIGKAGTRSPNFGPESGEHAIKNVYYSHDGRFRQNLEPGSYDVIISHGPEYDAVFTRLDLERGKDTFLGATLVRTVVTDGWISADFHSHSTPSGDNTSSQLGRVLNLLCEHIEFAPCTEHNRLSTYAPHLERLGAQRRMATCVGLELTGAPFGLNHQNAFPLVLVPNTQDNGAPESADDPETQIERLALWDAGSEKLVQVNHPDVGWMFHDRDGDREHDSGFSAMHGKMDVIEVHPPDAIFARHAFDRHRRHHHHTIVNWLKLLNQGFRIPGVVNTDAHHNFHGSGFLRNYVKSPTDDPAQVKTLDIVHAAERGNLVMTSGPFLEVKLGTVGGSARSAIPGDDLPSSGGALSLKVRVQCPNWFDVDRVQVFLNGRPAPGLNFTRETTPKKFSTGVVKFDQEIPLHFDRDTHVIVAAIGEKSRLGRVMGPDHAADRPVAVANPIFVDVDGGGFNHNGDPLGGLPVKRHN
jgi:hypothetical protein